MIGKADQVWSSDKIIYVCAKQAKKQDTTEKTKI